MKDNDLNNENEILNGQEDGINLTPEGEVWNKEAAINENLTEQLGRTNKRIKANLNRIKDELGLDKINSVIAELIEIYEKKIPVENNGIDIAADLIALDKSKKAIENIINSINTKTSIFEKEVKGSAANTQQQIDLSIKSLIDTINEINTRFEEKIKEQEDINSSLIDKLQEANTEIEVHKKVGEKLNKQLEDKEDEIYALRLEKNRVEAEVADAIQDNITLKNEINDLHELKEKNEELKNNLSEAAEEIRELEHNLSLKESSIESLRAENKTLTKSNADLKDENYTVKEESRSAIAELILKHKEELIDMKEKIKEEVEKKYEDRINKLKDEMYDLKKALEMLDKK